MNTFCRKTYNTLYYSKNKERILLRRQLRRMNHINQSGAPADQLSLFDHSGSDLKASNPRQRFNIEKSLNFFLVLLVLSNSYLLLRDAVEFYRFNDLHSETSVLAAVIVELMLIALSVIRISNPTLRYAAKCALVLLFIYSSWSFCSLLVGKGYGAIEQRSTIGRQIQRIEGQLKERELLIKENLKRHRITMAGRLTQEKDKLSEEISELENRRAMSLSTPAEAEKVNTLAMVALRLLLQFSNIVLVHHLSACFGKIKRARSASNPSKIAPAIRLVH